MEELVKILTKNNEKLTLQLESQAKQIKVLTEQVEYLTKKLFGSSSEKSVDNNQLSLFDEEPAVFKNRRQPK
ncbi:transposase [Vagococcus zengguangii]|uniref:Transposase n=1 Tax=Vagococcus zengguangii TaxID=2571750 RepID=A0A4D7CVH8_9ENTE|nr:transposase [Vagococcus zengguangii]QCI86281.1 transposase [Vagococcus zengguangii]TLG78262.1 transposase [Vagococcus zengguangii]